MGEITNSNAFTQRGDHFTMNIIAELFLKLEGKSVLLLLYLLKPESRETLLNANAHSREEDRLLAIRFSEYWKMHQSNFVPFTKDDLDKLCSCIVSNWEWWGDPVDWAGFTVNVSLEGCRAFCGWLLEHEDTVQLQASDGYNELLEDGTFPYDAEEIRGHEGFDVVAFNKAISGSEEYDVDAFSEICESSNKYQGIDLDALKKAIGVC